MIFTNPLASDQLSNQLELFLKNSWKIRIHEFLPEVVLRREMTGVNTSNESWDILFLIYSSHMYHGMRNKRNNTNGITQNRFSYEFRTILFHEI